MAQVQAVIRHEEKRDLETIIVVGIVLVIFGSIFNAGKREGSRKGYGVGFDRGRRSKSGCLVIIATTGFAVAAASAALACAIIQS